MDKPQQIILTFVCVMVALLLDWQIMRWLKKRTRSVRPKKSPGSQPEAPRPPFHILPLLNLVVAVTLIGFAQYRLASPGAVSYGISIWLNQHFFLDTPNLDNILTGLPVMLLGCILLIRTMQRFNLPAGETNPSGLLQNILPLALLRKRSMWLYMAGAGLVFFSLIIGLANKQYNGLSVVIWLVVPLVFLAVAWRWDRQSGPFAVIFYIIGAALTLAGFRQRRFALLLIWFGFMALALSAASTFPPRHQHMVGLIPALALLIGVGLVTLGDLLARLVSRFIGQAQKIFTGLLVLSVSMTGLYNFFVTMPQVYRPNFEQIIAWYGLYSQGQPFYYVYSLYERPDFKPYILTEMRKDVPYTNVSAIKLSKNPWLPWFAPHAMVFFSPDATYQVLPVLEEVWGKALQTTTFYNREWQVIGRAAWAYPQPVVLPDTFTAAMVDSYNRPVVWPIVFLTILLILCRVARRAWLERAPAWVRGGVDWLFQKAVELETWSQPGSAPALYFSADQK